jgi:diaminopimelate decarboxylase
LELVEEAVFWTVAVSDSVGRPPNSFDVGGGWHQQDFVDTFLPHLGRLQADVSAVLPTVDTIILEPGKAISSSTAILFTRVMEIRRNEPPLGAEAVVDASIADLPLARSLARPVLMVRAGNPVGWLSTGEDRILGSICMEADILLERAGFPVLPEPGDLLAFFDAGAYDASMSWPFAKGGIRDNAVEQVDR